jgi:hypothetical protein
VWACPDLQSGIDEFETMTAVRAEAGGRHPRLGTHNALIHIGNRSYLEIVAPDPEQDGGSWSRTLRELTEPSLLHWVIARQNLIDYTDGLTGLIGGQNEVTGIDRQHPILGLLGWELLTLPKHEFGCLVPFLIDWGDSTHPTELLEHRCTLRNIRITTPDLPDMLKIGSWLELTADFEEADEPRLEFVIDTPNGEVTLTTPQPLPNGVCFKSQ